MTWFKIDDGFAVHPKALTAGNEALGLWVRAGSWCAQQLTDGFLPKSMLKVLGSSEKSARNLVRAGLWEEGEDGYWFHDWGTYQPTRESVLSDRKAAAQRQQRARDRAVASRRDSRMTADVTNAVTDTEDTPASRRDSHDKASRSPRPDPTRPVPVVTEVTTREPARKRAQQLSDAWTPNDHHRQLAIERRVDLTEETARFRDYYRGTGKLMKDWDATFNNWIRNSRGGIKPPTTPDPNAWMRQ